MIIAEFSSPNCAACKVQKAVLEKLAAVHPGVKLRFYDLFSGGDDTEAMRLFSQTMCSSFPTVAFLSGDGRSVIYAESGLKTLDQLVNMIAKLQEIVK